MDLEQTRKEINEINQQMLALFERRMQCSISVAEYKKAHQMDIFDGKREKRILEEMTDTAKKELRPYVQDFFQNLMDISKDYQTNLLSDQQALKLSPSVTKEIAPKRLVYQGVDGSYSSEVCALFPESEACCVKNFEDVLLTLRQGEADYGVLPIENSSTGTIYEVYELLIKYRYYIVKDCIIKIDHNIVAPKGARLGDIEKLYSHPQGFMQCGEYLKSLEGVDCIPYINTAISAKAVAEWNDPAKGAISSRRAAELYGLDILQEQVNDKKDNYTRFVIISPKLEILEGAARVSIVFAVKHQSGALMKCLRAFAKRNLNLVKLESRPHPEKAWQYIFFADFDGNFAHENLTKVMEELQQETLDFQFLGNY